MGRIQPDTVQLKDKDGNITGSVTARSAAEIIDIDTIVAKCGEIEEAITEQFNKIVAAAENVTNPSEAYKFDDQSVKPVIDELAEYASPGQIPGQLIQAVKNIQSAAESAYEAIQNQFNAELHAAYGY